MALIAFADASIRITIRAEKGRGSRAISPRCIKRPTCIKSHSKSPQARRGFLRCFRGRGLVVTWSGPDRLAGFEGWPAVCRDSAIS